MSPGELYYIRPVPLGQEMLASLSSSSLGPINSPGHYSAPGISLITRTLEHVAAGRHMDGRLFLHGHRDTGTGLSRLASLIGRLSQARVGANLETKNIRDPTVTVCTYSASTRSSLILVQVSVELPPSNTITPYSETRPHSSFADTRSVFVCTKLECQ